LGVTYQKRENNNFLIKYLLKKQRRVQRFKGLIVQELPTWEGSNHELLNS